MSDLLHLLMGVAPKPAVQHGTLRDLLLGHTKPYPIPKGVGRFHILSDKRPAGHVRARQMIDVRYVPYFKRDPAPARQEERDACGVRVPNRFRVLDLLRKTKKPMRALEISEVLGCSAKHVRRYLAPDVASGDVRVIRPNKNTTFYEVAA